MKLPKPNGTFSVGTITYSFIDRSRKEIYSHDPRFPFREMVMQTWYPANVSKSDLLSPYVSKNLKIHIQEVLKKGEPILFGGAGYFDADVTSYSFNRPLVSEKKALYPVVLFSPGFGGPSFIYTNLFEELASQGYIVVAVNHTYNSEPTEFPDGRILRGAVEWANFIKNNAELENAHNREFRIWVADLQFALDQLSLINKGDPEGRLTGKLDLSRVGIVGHSFGGAAATSLCRIDPRVKCGVNMDGPLYGERQEVPFDKPFLFLFAKTFEVTEKHPNKEYYEKIVRKDEEKINILFESLIDDAFHIRCQEADHTSFTDRNFITDSHSSRQNQHLKLLQLTRKLLVTFFNDYLKGEPGIFRNLLLNQKEITVKMRLRKV